MTDPLPDPGLQPERTQLAWRRTTLALVVAAVVGLRVLPGLLGAAALVPALGGLALAAALWVLAERRARRVRQALARGVPGPTGAGLMLLLAVATSGGALGCLYVLLR